MTEYRPLPYLVPDPYAERAAKVLEGVKDHADRHPGERLEVMSPSWDDAEVMARRFAAQVDGGHALRNVARAGYAWAVYLSNGSVVTFSAPFDDRRNPMQRT